MVPIDYLYDFSDADSRACISKTFPETIHKVKPNKVEFVLERTGTEDLSALRVRAKTSFVKGYSNRKSEGHVLGRQTAGSAAAGRVVRSCDAFALCLHRTAGNCHALSRYARLVSYAELLRRRGYSLAQTRFCYVGAIGGDSGWFARGRLLMLESVRSL